MHACAWPPTSLSLAPLVTQWALQPGQEDKIVEATSHLKRAASDLDAAMQPLKKLKPAKS